MQSIVAPLRRSEFFLTIFAMASATILSAAIGAAHADEIDEAKKWFSETTTTQCRLANEIEALFSSDDFKPIIRHEIAHTDYEGKPEPDKTDSVVYEFFCDSGAYNRHHIFALHEDGLFTQLSFAQPTLSVKYEGDDTDAAVKSVTIIGYESRSTVVNPQFDAKTRTLKETGYWRGVGDASNESWWEFMGDRFVLRRFRVDASYDGEINPKHDFTWPQQ